MTSRPPVLVFVALLALSVALLRFQVTSPASLSAAVTPFTQLGTVAGSNLRGVVASLSSERHTAAQVEALTRQNEELRQKNALLQLEVTRLKGVVKITSTQAPSAVGVAQVIAVDPSPLLARLTINKGRADGVRLRMPVTVPAGLVGQVVAVGERQATVIALIDPESSVGVTLAGGKGGRGVAVGSPPDRLRVEFSAGVPVKVGDSLVSSSLGGVYPVGIRVGTVEKVLPLGSNDVTRTVIVKPNVDVGAIEDVTILEETSVQGGGQKAD